MPEDTEIFQKSSQLVPLWILVIIPIFVLPCLFCTLSRLIPYIQARSTWATYGASNYDITIVQSGYANQNPYLVPNVNNLLQIRKGKVVAVYTNGKQIALNGIDKYYKDSTVDGLFGRANEVLFSPFVTVVYNIDYGYPEAFYGGFIESGALTVKNIQLINLTPVSSTTPAP